MFTASNSAQKVPPPAANSPVWQAGTLRLRFRAWWIALGYAVVATLWIYFSDTAMALLIPDMDLLVRVSVYKGLGFVAVTSLILLLLMKHTFRAIEDGCEAVKRHEVEILRRSRLYSALSQINQSIVWSTSREMLFAKVCRALAEHGGFHPAWIAWHDPETLRLEPVAEFGDDKGYLKDIAIFSDERPEGRGPVGRAFREGCPVVCNDYSKDPATLPWREKALACGIRAGAAFPIQLNGMVVGTLNVYAGEADFFQEPEIALLSEAAMDLSFALDNFRIKEEREKAETIAQTEQLFSDTMIESMPGIVYFYDAEGKFLRWNSNFEAVSLYSREEIARMHPREFFTAKDQPVLEARIAEAFERGETSLEAHFLSKDGSQTPYFFTGRRVQFQDKTCLVGMGIDVSERHRVEQALRQSEQRYRTTLDNILEGCQILGFDLSYLYLNDVAETHNRRPNRDLLGRKMPEVWPGIERTRVFSMIKRCLKERTADEREVEFDFGDGTKGWFDVRVQPCEEGVLVLSIDKTKRKLAEDALRKLNQSLENQVAERTELLESALMRAEAADRIKSAFLATMSHELRTPLNSIIGFTGILLQEMAGPLNPEQTKQLGMVRGSARHLLALINDVLDISKIEAGQLEIRADPFDLEESTRRVVSIIQPMIDKHSLEFHMEIEPGLPPVHSDQRRVEQILLNLLNNAIKFTPQGHVLLSIDSVPGSNQSPEAVRIRVVDTGIGIKSEDLPLLFKPFRQLDSGLTRQHEGTGLGLAICKRLTELLGGEIYARSEWERGSEFTFILPTQRKTRP